MGGLGAWLEFSPMSAAQDTKEYHMEYKPDKETRLEFRRRMRTFPEFVDLEKHERKTHADESCSEPELFR